MPIPGRIRSRTPIRTRTRTRIAVELPAIFLVALVLHLLHNMPFKNMTFGRWFMFPPMLIAVSSMPFTACAAPALALDARPPSPTFKAAGNLGVGSAVGLVGATLTYAPIAWLHVEGGVGIGFTGLQLSTMGKLSFGSRSDRYVGGIGLSLAPHHVDAHGGSFVVPWFNLDAIGYEHRFPSGWSVTLIAGLTVALAKYHADYLPEVGEDVDRGTVYPQGRIEIGRWF